MRHRVLLFTFAALWAFPAFSQDKPQEKGQFSGNFQSNVQVYDRDDRIGANTTVYLHEKSSTDAWFFLNYNIYGFNFSARYDVFNNSPLLNPQDAYNGHGIGFWQISKDIDKLNVTVGSFYDQFGTGMVFRAYEDRLIGIDYAIQGVRAKYRINDNFQIKAFTGNQKGNNALRFGNYPQVIKGINAENRFRLSEKLNLDVGASLVNRTLDKNTMSVIATEINSYPVEERFVPKYNEYAYNAYATLSFGNFSLYGEYCGKTSEAIKDYSGKLINSPGAIYYGSLAYSKPGLGVNVQYKRIDHFQFRTSPFETLLNGLIAYLPSLTRQNTYRLLARYNAVVQELGETAIQGDIVFTPNPKTTISVNGSYVESLTGEKLFSEAYIDVQHKFNKQFKATAGLQRIFYNQEVYENKPGYENVHTWTPFGEITYKFDRRHSLRVEAQYLYTREDLGSFINGTIEFNVAPHYSISVSDMVNNQPYRHAGSNVSDEIIHYYSVVGAYTIKTSRFTFGYVKQVQGVNCTGGVCRVEPAFSGIRFTLTTNF